MSMSYQRADQTLEDALTNGTPHIWLHTGDPGENGTANVAQLNTANIDRKSVTFGVPENHSTNDERICLNTDEIEWSGAEIDDSQEITHFSVWSAASNGQLEFLETIAESKVTGSDGVTIQIGDLEIAIGVYVKPA